MPLLPEEKRTERRSSKSWRTLPRQIRQLGWAAFCFPGIFPVMQPSCTDQYRESPLHPFKSRPLNRLSVPPGCEADAVRLASASWLVPESDVRLTNHQTTKAVPSRRAAPSLIRRGAATIVEAR